MNTDCRILLTCIFGPDTGRAVTGIYDRATAGNESRIRREQEEGDG